MTQPALGLDHALLEEIRRRRAELRDSMGALEMALAGPVGSDHARWSGRVHVALVELSADLRLHVDLTEGPGGLYNELREASPRLSAAVDALCGEHTQLRRDLDDLLLLLDGPYPSSDAAAIRHGGTTVLGAFARHRQRGADLVYEAFAVDVGGET
jgi:hypothetical protein